MPLESSAPWMWAVVSILAVVLLAAYRAREKRLRLPPGPPGLPLLGNLFDMPMKNLGQGFSKLAQKYGDVVYLNILGQSTVVLSSLQAARDLLEKRSANYSDRPDSVMVGLTGLDCLFVLMSYGDRWRLHRRAFHQSFNESAVKQHQPVQLWSARKLLAALLHTPHDLGAHTRFSFSSSLMQVAYGIELKEKDDEYFHMVEQASAVGAVIAIPGRFPVDAVRGLQYLPSWFPGGGFKQWSARAKATFNHNLNRLYKTAVDGLDAGTGRHSLISRVLEDASSYDLKSAGERDVETFAKRLAITTYATGSDTSHATLQAFFLAMAMFPEVQKKAQEELDRVVGSTRLPEFEDRDSLPYLNALLKELLRWHPITPIAVPHRTVADDVYDGRFIPAKTIIAVNVWTLSRDPVRYPSPEMFLPERFLDGNGKLDLSSGDPAELAFGFGRRICPGRHFADTSLFILAASVLHVYNILPPLDERGNPTKMTHSYLTNGAVAYPEFYNYDIKPRFSNAKELILEACDENVAASF